MIFSLGTEVDLGRYKSFAKLLLYSMLGASGLFDVYYGFGIGLFLWKKSTVHLLLDLIAGDQLHERARGVLSGWGWHSLQFTNLF